MNRPGAYNGMPLPNRLLALSSRHMPWLTKLIRRMMRRMILSDVEKATRQILSSVPDADKELIYTPENFNMLAQDVTEGFRPGWQGAAHDDIVLARDWDFDLGNIQVRMDIWQGEADVSVPRHEGEYLHSHIPSSHVTFLPDEGHMLIFKRWGEILEALLAG